MTVNAFLPPVPPFTSALLNLPSFETQFLPADSSLVANNQIDVPLNLNPRHNQWPQRMDISIRPSL